MLRSVDHNVLGEEGYVFAVFGDNKYLKHVLASITTLRRYDTQRPVALLCEPHHFDLLKKYELDQYIDFIRLLDKAHTSITGFKHNTHQYLLFKNTIFLDSDILVCKNPDPLWKMLKAHPYTITGRLVADHFFGAPKSMSVLKDIIMRRRKSTLKRFGLTYLNRIQSGLIFCSDYEMTEKVNKLAQNYLSYHTDTHFKSRTMEIGRSEESCEWSLAMAMAKLEIPVFPWQFGHMSTQLDYFQQTTHHDPDFKYVRCLKYNSEFVDNMKALRVKFVRAILMWFFSWVLGKYDYMYTTPYFLHFGWYHQKEPLNEFAERNWLDLINKGESELSQLLQLKKRSVAD